VLFEKVRKVHVNLTHRQNVPCGHSGSLWWLNKPLNSLHKLSELEKQCKHSTTLIFIDWNVVDYYINYVI